MVQPKLTINRPEDKYEQEADRVAEAVMRMPEPEALQKRGVRDRTEPPQIQRLCSECEEELQRQPLEEEEEETIQTKSIASQITPLIQRQVEPEEEDEEDLQAKELPGRTPGVTPQTQARRACACSGGCPKCQAEQLSHQPQLLQNRRTQENDAGATVASPFAHEVLRSPGQPLDAKTRAFMGSRFGRDFGEVRIHTSSKAAETSHSIGARAFTLGQHIFFGAGEYDVKGTEGRRLLAHELTHTLQQTARGFSPC